MTIQEYANQNLGTQLDNGQGGYKGECVSLAIRTMKDVYSVPYGTLYCLERYLPNGQLDPNATGGAIELFRHYDTGTISQYFDKITNNPNDYNQLPQPGDLIIWGTYMGKYGHVGVVIQANPLKVFQQLGTPVFSKSEIKQYPTYNGVLGWLRPKVTNTPQGGDMPTTLESAKQLAAMAAKRDPNDQASIADLQRNHVGRDPLAEINEWFNSPERKAVLEAEAKREEVQQRELANMQAALNSLSERPTKEEYARVQAQLSDSAVALKQANTQLDEAKKAAKTVYIENPETGKKLDAILSIVKSIWGSVTSLHKKIK